MGHSATRRVLMPTYLTKFVCDGQHCDDNCCARWRVDIDRATYKKYQQVRSPELRKALDAAIKRNRDNPSDHRYAIIRLDANGNCPLLTPDKLCGVQLNLGYDHLCEVCAGYPRNTNLVNGVYERSATLSCPIAARLALLDPNPMSFDETTEPDSVRMRVGLRIDTNGPSLAEHPARYLWEMRVFTIDLLQDRTYTLAERLIILGMFCQKLQHLVEDGHTAEIPLWIGKYGQMAARGGMKAELAGVPSQVTFQLRLLKELIDIRAGLGFGDERYIECLRECLMGLDCTAEATPEQLTERYRTGYQLYYEPFMRQHSYTLENYLVNYVFAHLFPASPEKERLFGAYTMLVIHYALIKMHLIGMSLHHQALSEELVVKLVQSLVKAFEHNTLFERTCYDLLAQNGYDSMAAMAMLIQD